MIRTIIYDPETRDLQHGGEELIQVWNENQRSTLWLDFEKHDKQQERDVLEKIFNINKLAVDDAQRDRHPPKLEFFKDYFFLLLKAFNAETDSINFGILHISFFVGSNFIITRHDGVSPSVNKNMELAKEAAINLDRGSEHFCYKVVRSVVDRYTPVILKLEKRLEDMEDLMLKKPDDTLLSELINYNSRLKKLRRIFNYQEAIFVDMTEYAKNKSSHKSMHEYQDIHEQMERLSSLSDLFQGLARDLIDGYISVTSHRLNQIMKALTIVAVIFLPLTFLAGIYGMNFEYMPELHYKLAYFIVIGVMVLIATGLIILFKKLKWL